MCGRSILISLDLYPFRTYEFMDKTPQIAEKQHVMTRPGFNYNLSITITVSITISLESFGQLQLQLHDSQIQLHTYGFQ